MADRIINEGQITTILTFFRVMINLITKMTLIMTQIYDQQNQERQTEFGEGCARDSNLPGDTILTGNDSEPASPTTEMVFDIAFDTQDITQSETPEKTDKQTQEETSDENKFVKRLRKRNKRLEDHSSKHSKKPKK